MPHMEQSLVFFFTDPDTNSIPHEAVRRTAIPTFAGVTQARKRYAPASGIGPLHRRMQ